MAAAGVEPSTQVRGRPLGSRRVGAGRSVPNFFLVFPGVFVGPVRRTAIRDTKSVPAQRLIGGGVLVSVAATALIWWQPNTVVSVAGFVLLGAALAGMFPALIAVTPQRIGEPRAQHAIAWQVGAAAGGGSAISALVGLLINTSGLDVVGPALVVLALLLLAANTALTRLAPIPTERVSRGSARR